MKASDIASAILQLTLIFMISASGVYALSNYPFGMLVLEFLCDNFNRLVVSYRIPFFSSYEIDPQMALTILIILLCLWGIRSVVIKGGDGKIFVSLAGLLLFPSVLNYSYLGWSTGPDYLSGVSRFLETELSFYECTSLMVLIVIGLLSFRFVAMFRKDRKDLLIRGGGEEDVGKVFSRAHIYMSLAMSGILLILVVLLSPLALINNFMYYLIETIPLGLMTLGIAFSLLILVSTYFFIKKASLEKS